MIYALNEHEAISVISEPYTILTHRPGIFRSYQKNMKKNALTRNSVHCRSAECLLKIQVL